MPIRNVADIFSDIAPELLFTDRRTISSMNLDGGMVNTIFHRYSVWLFDIDSVENMLYYYDQTDECIKRYDMNQTTTETIHQYTKYALDWNPAVDWIGR